MKTLPFLCIAFSLVKSIAVSASEIPEGLLLFRYDDSGFAPPQYAFTRTCEMYADFAIISLQNKDGYFTTEKKYPMDSSWKALIDLASNGKLQQSESPADVPTRAYAAYQKIPSNEVKEITLFHRDSDGFMQTNLAPEAEKLMRIADQICD